MYFGFFLFANIFGIHEVKLRIFFRDMEKKVSVLMYVIEKNRRITVYVLMREHRRKYNNNQACMTENKNM